MDSTMSLPVGLPLHFQVSLSDGGNVSCSGKKDTDVLSSRRGQRAAELSGPGVATPGKSILSLETWFSFPPCSKQSQAVGSSAAVEKQTLNRSPSHISADFSRPQMGTWLTDKNGWIYGKTTGRGAWEPGGVA